MIKFTPNSDRCQIGSAYMLWQSREGSTTPAIPGAQRAFTTLIEERIAQPIGAGFEYSLKNFDLPAKARINVFRALGRVS